MHKVAIWGAGTMGRVHAGCYERSEEARAVYVIDQDLAKAQELASTCEARAMTDPAVALSDPEVDVVDVCLPTYLHRQSVEQAARSGKHVLCEKPAALSAADAKAMIDTCRACGVKLGIAHVLRYFPEYEMARQMITSGDLGQIGTVRLSRVGPFPRGWRDWYADEARSGGLLLDLSIHDFDFLRWCFGPVDHVYARKVRDDRPLEYALVVVRMKNGVIAHVEGSWAHPGPFSYRFEVCGSSGMIEYDSLKARPLSIVTAAPTGGGGRGNGQATGTGSAGEGGGGAPGVAVPESPLRDREPYLREIRDFLAYVRGEGIPRVLPEDAVAALKISLAATRSALTGKVVSVS